MSGDGLEFLYLEDGRADAAFKAGTLEPYEEEIYLEMRSKRLNDATPEDWDRVRKVWRDATTKGCPTPSVRAIDRQHGGNHYKGFKIQPIEYIQANNLSYEQGNVVKYISRYKEKNGIEDLKKAIHYIELIIEGMNNE